jgi:hypothetical protein
MSGIELIPSAKRLIGSLRGMGYDFAQAVADIVDNSIMARATLIAIDIEFDGDDSWVRIADNGIGMNPEELREAMRYGSDRDYAQDDLGKFGLGLKTASLSQCRRLSVASRWNPGRADISAYLWDLDHIERTNKWEILPIDRNGLGPAIREPLRDTTGTVVLWQRLDRLLGYKHPYGETARKRLSQMCRDVEVHLGMVFHRFMTGTTRRKRVKMLMNGNAIASWDPFCRAEPKTKVLQAITIPIEHEGMQGEVVLEPFILPHQDDFSSPEAFRAASGPASWNQQQGFYIYRADRLIQSGGWSNMRAPDEHIKLARIAVHFSPNLDEAFKVNVAKMRVQLPSQISQQVRQATLSVVKHAREVYDRKAPVSTIPQRNKPSVPEKTVSTSPYTPANGGQTRPPGSPPDTGTSVRVLLTMEQWADRLRQAASPTERPVIDAVLSRLSGGLA